MTLPLERSRSIMHARRFLLDLMDSKKTPKVPKKIRTRAYQVLKHLPTVYDVNHAADGAPEIFDHICSHDWTVLAGYSWCNKCGEDR